MLSFGTTYDFTCKYFRVATDQRSDIRLHESPPPARHHLDLCAAVRRRRRHRGAAAQAGRAGARPPAARSRCRDLRGPRHRAQPHRLRSARCPSSPPATRNSSAKPASPSSAISTRPPWPCIAAHPKPPRTAPHAAKPATPKSWSATTTRPSCAQYLRQHARSAEAYRDVDVFSFPIENRTLRVALLAIDTVAISNVDDPDVIHGIIDRFKKVALPFGGPSLVRDYYRKIPLGSLLWAIAAPALILELAQLGALVHPARRHRRRTPRRQ